MKPITRKTVTAMTSLLPTMALFHQAKLSVDGGAPEIVDTYSADDIWGVAIYRREFATSGRHTLRITVLGEHGPRATDSIVHVDGVRVE